MSVSVKFPKHVKQICVDSFAQLFMFCLLCGEFQLNSFENLLRKKLKFFFFIKLTKKYKYVRSYEVLNMEHCAPNLPMQVDIKFPRPSTDNAITSSGTIILSEKITGPLDLSLETSRCTSDMKTCEKYDTVNFKEVCKKMVDPSFMFSYIAANIKPSLKCPASPGNYTIPETKLNLNIISMVPLDGYIYTDIIKLTFTEDGKKSKKLMWCFKVEVKVDKVRVKL